MQEYYDYAMNLELEPINLANYDPRRYNHFPNYSLRPSYAPWVCKENVCLPHEVEEMMAITNGTPDLERTNAKGELMVKTWHVTELMREKYTHVFENLLNGSIEIQECSIKKWYKASQIHTDGNGYDLTVYIPLGIEAADNYVMLENEQNINSSLILYNAQLNDVNTLFLDVPQTEIINGRRVQNSWDKVEIVREHSYQNRKANPLVLDDLIKNTKGKAYRSYNKFLLDHVPEKFRNILRLNMFPFVNGLGVAFNPRYLHSSNNWEPYLKSRTHVLAAIKLKSTQYWI
jgi:hypothetical protein